MFVLYCSGVKTGLGPAFGDDLLGLVSASQPAGILLCQGCDPQTLVIAEWQFCPPKLVAQSVNYSTLVEATRVAGGGLTREGRWPWGGGRTFGGVPLTAFSS